MCLVSATVLDAFFSCHLLHSLDLPPLSAQNTQVQPLPSFASQWLSFTSHFICTMPVLKYTSYCVCSFLKCMHKTSKETKVIMCCGHEIILKNEKQGESKCLFQIIYFLETCHIFIHIVRCRNRHSRCSLIVKKIKRQLSKGWLFVLNSIF
jgi:hypothetical protein